MFQKLQDALSLLLLLFAFKVFLFHFIPVHQINCFEGEKMYSQHFLRINLSCMNPKQGYLVLTHRRFIQLEFYFIFLY